MDSAGDLQFAGSVRMELTCRLEVARTGWKPVLRACGQQRRGLEHAQEVDLCTVCVWMCANREVRVLRGTAAFSFWAPLTQPLPEGEGPYRDAISTRPLCAVLCAFGREELSPCYKMLHDPPLVRAGRSAMQRPAGAGSGRCYKLLHRFVAVRREWPRCHFGRFYLGATGRACGFERTCVSLIVFDFGHPSVTV
jgi:hypothetical protein